ncbi:MAG: hypothetical protein J3K34DRAFT_409182 [Monoraphidium minutum]|nr:MAG: hypothetical protein J3K34DRAFT_409182 [Monoraphidium minutum]
MRPALLRPPPLRRPAARSSSLLVSCGGTGPPRIWASSTSSAAESSSVEWNGAAAALPLASWDALREGAPPSASAAAPAPPWAWRPSQCPGCRWLVTSLPPCLRGTGEPWDSCYQVPLTIRITRVPSERRPGPGRPSPVDITRALSNSRLLGADAPQCDSCPLTRPAAAGQAASTSTGPGQQ